MTRTRTARFLATVAVGATAFAAFQGTASAQTREHVLLARQTQVPATTSAPTPAPAGTTLGTPTRTAAHVDFYLTIDGVDGEGPDGGGSGGGGGETCWDWTDAETGKAMSNCP